MQYFVILVPAVRFEAFSGLVVPQPQGIVQRPGENKFRVRTEFNKETGRLFSLSINVFKHCPDWASQIRIKPSYEAEAIKVPSLLK